MLRLNPSTLSWALGQQLLESAAHLSPTVESVLLPLITQRLLDPTLQCANSGSIGLGSALTLFLAAHQRAPMLIAEVGTYIGNSAAAMGLGAGTAAQAFQLVTCDLHPGTQQPLAGLTLPPGSGAQWFRAPAPRCFRPSQPSKPSSTCSISTAA